MLHSAHYIRRWRMRCNTAEHEATILRLRPPRAARASCAGLCRIEQGGNGAQHSDRPVTNSFSQSQPKSESLALTGSRL